MSSIQDYSSHFRSLVETSLPENSRVLTLPASTTLVILATWRLTGNASHPSWRSPVIRIVIDDKALRDYARSSDGFRIASEWRFFSWLRGKLANLDTNLFAPTGAERPPVTWQVRTIDLNG